MSWNRVPDGRNTERERERERETYRQTDRQTDGRTDRQTDRQTGEREREREVTLAKLGLYTRSYLSVKSALKSYHFKLPY